MLPADFRCFAANSGRRFTALHFRHNRSACGELYLPSPFLLRLAGGLPAPGSGTDNRERGMMETRWKSAIECQRESRRENNQRDDAIGSDMDKWIVLAGIGDRMEID